jgi:hypothetical protein
MGISEENAEKLLKGFVLAVSLVLSVWILVSPLDLLFKVAWWNYNLYALVSGFYPYKKYPKYKYWQIAWGIFSLLLLVLHTLIDTGRL